MKLSEAKILCKAGALIKATLYRSDDGIGWSLKFESIQSDGTYSVLVTQKGTVRVFKSTDAAFLTLAEIGFQKVECFL